MKYEDEFDGLLNDALREVREAEPRMGLEGRVLAGVSAGAEERRSGWWKWAAVAAMVVLIVLGIAVRKGSRVDVVRKEPLPVVVPEKKAAETTQVEVPEPRSEVKVRSVAKERPRRKFGNRGTEVVASAQMLVPSPLTEQEKALVRLARNNPEVLTSLQSEESLGKREIAPIEIDPIQIDRLQEGR